ncbi:MAG: TusE/DsrC/DsvC family sulfur relay protein [Anaerolineae bacterium]|jgi:tRNA 2-thiouridine synthesizing protein E|nr:TusE/DsrC/DsvC family sulfur relay protein [Anaerolineae bacterium]
MTTLLDTLAFNDEGYLLNWQQWNEQVAYEIAAEEGIELTDRHWIVIHFARKIYAENGDAPTLRQITKQTDVSTKEMYTLFPDGPAKKAAMIAGLPKPTGCI